MLRTLAQLSVGPARRWLWGTRWSGAWAGTEGRRPTGKGDRAGGIILVVRDGPVQEIQIFRSAERKDGPTGV